ncbi:hypothetical protein GCM10012287_49590 [Streptomyces daqingensis]|uniref:Extracellular small neutral protease n=1 Tax=Streptomyces daqingensis TaxID=1472640 RepID=A0ABQ2MR41_9ACTN|nr:snapalysin family zinc-dependent metalloprotease [Streptomyces daqingensis]GGO56305.1 hypothetical protein GCM10012287_49590 [Streptomyces daqingensis]
MRKGSRRLATAACIPLTLLALSACGPGKDTDSARKPDSASSGQSDAPGKAGKTTGEGGGEQGPAADEPDETSADLPADEPAPGGPGDAVTYDVSEAAEYAEPVSVGVAAWNDSLENVEIRPAKAGEKADVRIVVEDGWPEARTKPLQIGAGTIVMGRAALDAGHSSPRIAAHEFGHILGLDDRRNEGCSSLMSGHKGGKDCPSWHPDSSETRAADANFAEK